MNIIGIVTEYNPLHNGHIYQIKKIKEMYPESIIVVAMSANYTMRGEISVLDKWTKTKLCLENGIDIVLEIPFIYANQSSDIFSYAAIKMLSAFKIDTLVFGSESNNLDKLKAISKVQIDNNEFDTLVKKYLDKGYNYPTSLAKSIHDITGYTIKESNDILAVSYIKEIIKNNYNINIVPIKRTNSFKSNLISSDIISAYQIRQLLKSNINISKYIPYNKKYIRNIDYAKLFLLIKYKVISEYNKIEEYHLITEGIEKRIYEAILKSDNYEELVNYVSNKRVTINKVNRMLINIFVGFTKEDKENTKNLSYIKLLGLSSEGKKYYSKIKKNISIPVYTKFEKNVMDTELKASYLYSLIVNDKSIFKSEITSHVITK